EWAEQEMKAGRYLLPPAPPGSRPDLTHLSCRWAPIASRRGLILSLIVKPSSGADFEAFAALVRRLLTLVAAEDDRHGQPGTRSSLAMAWPPLGADLEARATRGQKWLARRRVEVWLYTLFAF